MVNDTTFWTHLKTLEQEVPLCLAQCCGKVDCVDPFTQKNLQWEFCSSLVYHHTHFQSSVSYRSEEHRAHIFQVWERTILLVAAILKIRLDELKASKLLKMECGTFSKFQARWGESLRLVACSVEVIPRLEVALCRTPELVGMLGMPFGVEELRVASDVLPCLLRTSRKIFLACTCRWISSAQSQAWWYVDWQ